MIGRQDFNVACFTLLVNAYLSNRGELEKFNESGSWTTLLDFWGTAVGLSPETLAELRNEHYFIDPFSSVLDIRQQLDTGMSPIDILQTILENQKGGQLVLRKSIAQSCADHLAAADTPSGLPILCCDFSAFPVVASLLQKGLSVDWHLHQMHPAVKDLLSKLAQIIGSGHLTIKDLEERGGMLAIRDRKNGAFSLPRGYDIGFYSLPISFTPALDQASADELAPSSLVVHAAEILWSNKQSYQNFREEIVNSHFLQNVLLLPQGSTCLSMVQLAALTVSKKASSDKVLFADFSDEKVGKKDSPWQIPFDKLTDISVPVPVRELIDGGYLLDVKRHVMAGSKELRTMTSGDNAMLKDLVSITRAQSIPVAKVTTSSCIELKEVLASDIDDLGIIRSPKKIIHVDRHGATRAFNAWLKRGDILIAIKGSVGKIGFVENELADMTEIATTKEKWVAGQSFVKVRIKPSQANKLTPEYLFRYLKSPQVQKYFESRSLGMAIPMIKMTDIETLPVRLPTAEILERETERHNRQLLIRKEIDRLQHELKSYELDLTELS